MKATRRQQVEGRDIRVYDDLLATKDILVLTDMLENGAFTRDEVARPDTTAFRHWVLNIPLKVAEQLPVYSPTVEAAGDFWQGQEFQIYRCYCNYASHGDMLFTHTDCEPGQKSFTALWYIMPDWDIEWGGETLFFNTSMDAEVVVTPRPGRLVIFDANITHVGRPPNRICYAPRYTLAFKLGPRGAIVQSPIGRNQTS